MMSDWKHEWSERFATVSSTSSVLINDEDFYLKWVDNLNVSLYEREIRINWLTEVANKINAKIKAGSVFTSDMFVNGHHVLLIDEDLSKVDILEKNAIFKKVILGY